MKNRTQLLLKANETMNEDLECPTPCVCGRIVELDDMYPIAGTLPNGGNLVCDECRCLECDGDGQCDKAR